MNKDSPRYELIRYDVHAQVQESSGQELKGRTGGRPRASRAAVAKSAGPSSPTASWDSAPAQQSRTRSQYGASQAQYPVGQNASNSYDKVWHLHNSLMITMHNLMFILTELFTKSFVLIELSLLRSIIAVKKFPWCPYIDSVLLMER